MVSLRVLLTEAPQLSAPGAGWWFVPPEFLPVQKPEASLLPRAFLPPPFLKLDIRRCSYAKLLPRSVSCVARWNLPARGFRRGLFLSAQGTVPAAGVPALLFLCGAASAMRELQHLLDCAYLWGTQTRLVRLATSLSPRMRSQLFCHLRLNLTFPLLVFRVLFRLRARGA